MRHTLTIMNDASVTDGNGFIHTWLVYQKEGYDARYFSFSNNGVKLFGFPGVVSEYSLAASKAQ